MKRLIVLFFVFILFVVIFFNKKDETLMSLSDDLSVIAYEACGECECIVFENTVDEIINKLDIQVINKFYIDDREVVEGYVYKLNKYIVNDMNKINIQLSSFDGFTKVGYPLIKNSF